MSIHLYHILYTTVIRGSLVDHKVMAYAHNKDEAENMFNRWEKVFRIPEHGKAFRVRIYTNKRAQTATEIFSNNCGEDVHIVKVSKLPHAWEIELGINPQNIIAVDLQDPHGFYRLTPTSAEWVEQN